MLCFPDLRQLPAADVDHMRPGFHRPLDGAREIELGELAPLVIEDWDQQSLASRRDALQRPTGLAKEGANDVRAVL